MRNSRECRVSLKTNKKAQEEIVGFVLIMVIVAVVFVILLALFIRQQGTGVEKTSQDVFSFLSSTMKYTTSCVIRQGSNNIEVSELINECYSNSVCLDGKNACSVLNDTLKGILDSGWNVGKQDYAKGYIFNSTYKSDSTRKEIIGIKKGECSFNKQGADYTFSAYPGTINSVLKICF